MSRKQNFAPRYILFWILQGPIYKGVQCWCTVNALFHGPEIGAWHRPELGSRSPSAVSYSLDPVSLLLLQDVLTGTNVY